MKPTEIETQEISYTTQKARIRNAFERGLKLTSYEANKIGKTVDSRKCISDLRKEGVKIDDDWTTGKDGRRFKIYFIKPENLAIATT